MNWAAVPKTAVNEHGEFRLGEHDIGASMNARDYRPVDAKPHALGVQDSPHGNLRDGIALTSRLHAAQRLR